MAAVHHASVAMHYLRGIDALLSAVSVHFFSGIFNIMLKISIIDSYVQTFEGTHLIPLAIHNSSAQADRDITVSIKVNNDSVEIMVPSSELINKDLIGLEGSIYEMGVIKELLIMPETSDIKYDSDITNNLNESLSYMQKTTSE